ncbi:hypothetical protein DOY81_002632, partial [Sarcophaga bullata]
FSSAKKKISEKNSVEGLKKTTNFFFFRHKTYFFHNIFGVIINDQKEKKISSFPIIKNKKENEIKLDLNCLRNLCIEIAQTIAVVTIHATAVIAIIVAVILRLMLAIADTLYAKTTLGIQSAARLDDSVICHQRKSLLSIR